MTTLLTCLRPQRRDDRPWATEHTGADDNFVRQLRAWNRQSRLARRSEEETPAPDGLTEIYRVAAEVKGLDVSLRHALDDPR